MSFALGARRSREAFTIMEVMIAVVIIGILAAIAGPPILKRMRAVNVNSTKSTMGGIKSALMLFKSRTPRNNYLIFSPAAFDKVSLHVFTPYSNLINKISLSIPAVVKTLNNK